MAERLQKLISAAGLMSRRAAEECIAAGRVTVNGQTASLGDKADIAADSILVDGRPLPPIGRQVYIMLNKPRGYVTTLSDEKGRKNVTALIQGCGRLYPVGRLDMYSEGLLIMTNDGDFANTLMHPSHEFKKTYRTWVRGQNIAGSVSALRRDIDVDGYTVRAVSVIVETAAGDSAVLLITIGEGRNRQVRKMCQSCGLKVTRLMRISEGPLALGGLESGKWRFLSEDELRSIEKTSAGGEFCDG